MRKEAFKVSGAGRELESEAVARFGKILSHEGEKSESGAPVEKKGRTEKSSWEGDNLNPPLPGEPAGVRKVGGKKRRKKVPDNSLPKFFPTSTEATFLPIEAWGTKGGKGEGTIPNLMNDDVLLNGGGRFVSLSDRQDSGTNERGKKNKGGGERKSVCKFRSRARSI